MSDLRIPSEHLKAILDAIPDGIGVELDGVIVWANLGFARLYGYDHPAEVVNHRTTDFVTPEDGERLMSYTARRWTHESAPNHYFFRGLRKDGLTVEVEIFVTSFESGGHRYVLGALRDQTERIMLARRLELSQRLEALGTLARGISHDFNNLLGSILGNVDMAEVTLDQGADPQRFLDRIRKAADKGAQLTRQLQTFTGHRSWEGQTASAVEILHDTEDLLAHSSHDVQVVVDAPASLPPVGMAPGQLQQILMNLAINALDAMPNGGVLIMSCAEVEVSAADVQFDGRPGAYLRFQVEDTGDGIRPSDLPRIFEPFFTTKPADKGTGLGLSVVFGTVRSHGGWIEVESEQVPPRQGTRFTFHLPVYDGPVTEEEEEPEGEVRARPGEGVMVVDDDPGMRTFLQEALENEGYRVYPAENGERALRLLETRGVEPQVVVVDLVMPGMDGVECSIAMKVLRPHLRVILCTGLVQDDRIAGLPPKMGARVLRKPVTTRRLLRGVRRAMEE